MNSFVTGPILFTPGDRPERFEKAWVASRGRLILDLEDGVAPEAKSRAREAITHWLAQTQRKPLVRINASDSAEFQSDIRELAGLAFAGVVLPKTARAEELDSTRAAWPGIPLFPLIESALGLAGAVRIAQSPGVSQLMLGALDLHADCGVHFPHLGFLEHARIQLVLASRQADIAPPIDSPYPNFRNETDVAADAACLGFAGKLCIHPAQLPIVSAAFRPTPDQIEWAQGVLAAAETGRGAVQFRGQMIDAPVIRAAQTLLRRDRDALLPGEADGSSR